MARSPYCKHVKAGKTYLFQAAGMDRFDRRASTPEDGSLVKAIKSPRGTPPMGTMGHCYVADMNDRFIGLVLCSSLKPVNVKRAPSGNWYKLGAVKRKRRG